MELTIRDENAKAIILFEVAEEHGKVSGYIQGLLETGSKMKEEDHEVVVQHASTPLAIYFFLTHKKHPPFYKRTTLEEFEEYIDTLDFLGSINEETICDLVSSLVNDKQPLLLNLRDRFKDDVNKKLGDIIIDTYNKRRSEIDGQEGVPKGVFTDEFKEELGVAFRSRTSLSPECDFIKEILGSRETLSLVKEEFRRRDSDDEEARLLDLAFPFYEKMMIDVVYEQLRDEFPKGIKREDLEIDNISSDHIYLVVSDQGKTDIIVLITIYVGDCDNQEDHNELVKEVLGEDWASRQQTEYVVYLWNPEYWTTCEELMTS